jgi:hypothetical protein
MQQSIQSFYQKEIPSVDSPDSAPKPLIPSDGFTSGEINDALHPMLPKWNPRGTYDETDIGSLQPGLGCVAVTGRIVNLFDLPTPSKRQHAAKGCYKLVIKDDTGAMTVLARCCSLGGRDIQDG